MVNDSLKLPDYPIKKAFGTFKETLQNSRALALEAPTGSGKTTLLPILMLQAGLSSKKILLTQPRRLAAKSVAARMSSLTGSPLGKLVGYRVRGESKVSEETKIEVVTEGYALALLQADPFLTDYDWLILDEFHERHIEGDLLLALLRDLRQSVGAKDCPGMVVMTATWQGQPREAFGEFSFHSVEGRLYPVERRWDAGPPETELERKLSRGVRLAVEETDGKILVFLPGRRELENARRILTEQYPDAEISLLYGGMELSVQQKVLQYDGRKRQIILATAVAETSLTIEGITAVVDSGLERLPVYQSSQGLTRLVTRRLSRATSDQRAGRAGRLGPGICFCLWTNSEDRELIQRRDPEIITGDLSRARLQAALWGRSDLNWISPPPDGLWAQAGELLRQLDALDETGVITERGKLLATLPLSPRLGHMVAEAPNTENAALAAAVLSGSYRFRREHGSFTERLADARSLKEAASLRREAQDIAHQVRKSMKASGAGSRQLSTGALLSLAYPDRIGRKSSPGSYELVTGSSLRCPACCAEWAVFPEISGPHERHLGRLAEVLTFDEIISLHPQMLRVKRDITYLPDTGGFKVVRMEMIGKLEIKMLPADKAGIDEKLQALRSAIKKRGPEVLHLDKNARRLLGKLKTASGAGIIDLPSGEMKTLADTIDDWLAPWLQQDILTPKLVSSALEVRLDWQQKSRLDTIFPRQVVLRPGMKKDVDYSNPQQPLIRGRVQEFYGLSAPLTIAEGKIRLAIELLSPAMRPLQTTSDLEAFWKGSWIQIRSEMRGRYPRHYWPEDPAAAEPSLATGKRRPE